VCSTLLETKEAEKISKTFQRPVLYWDNYPVNDASMAPELHIGPYTGREGGLYKCSSGIILNPMSRAYASLIALYSAGEYFEKKEQFNPIESWKKAIKKIAPNSYQAFQEFAEVNMKSPLSSNPSKHIQTILQHYFDLYSAQKKEDAAKHLINTGKKITSNADIIKNDIHPNLFTDIQIWLHEYRYWGETLSLIGQVILADLSMYREDNSQKKLDEVTAKNKQLEERLKRAVSFHTTVFGNELFSFALDRLRISKGLVSMYRY
jgi:hyaluronoglucosaminidase